LPLLALPPVRTRVSDRTASFLQHQRLDLHFAQIRAGNRHPQNTHAAEEGVCWQAQPNLDSDTNTIPPKLALDTGALSTQKPSLPKNKTLPAHSARPRGTANPQILAIRENLVRRGAQYMRLDEVAGEPVAYHFYCLMPVSDRAVYSRRFATIDSDPIRAMARVLDEVECWQNKRSSL